MTTLVISDLHLGNQRHGDIVRLPAVRERLFAALEEIDRLVLLGDTVELLNRRPDRSMRIAEPVLRALGQRLGPDREVVLVAGNHDAPLVRRWALSTAHELTPDHDVPLDATPALRTVVSWLAPARVQVRYPGVWIGDRLWATHGHYLDRHLLPTSALGVPRPGRAGLTDPGAGGYELATARRHTGRRRDRSRRHPAVLTRRASLRAFGFTVFRAPRLLLRNGMAPLTARAIDLQMRHASIPAMARVTAQLGVQADTVVFGHVHRRGPIGGEPWPHPDGTTYLNTGSWLREPLLIDRAQPPHPYWPGGAVIVDDRGIARSVGLLDDLSDAELARAAANPELAG